MFNFKKHLRTAALLLGAVASVALITPASAAKKPNVIVVFVDDMGWGDAPWAGFDRGVKMPNLNDFAMEGMRFTNWYGEASCTPGRAALQTGRIPMRSALTVALGPGDQNRLRQENRTIAEFYRDNGYQTYFSGKWHLGDTQESMPSNNGYDTMEHFLAYYAGVYAFTNAELHPAFPRDNKKFMTAYNKAVNDGEWRADPGKKPVRFKEHFGYDDLADFDKRQTDTAIKYLTAHAKDDKPIFMNINYMKFHQPNNPAKAFKGKSKQGIYYDSMLEIDSYLGRLKKTIKDLGMDKNTILVFSTDNGPWIDAAPDAGYTPFRGMKGTPYEGGWRVPGLIWAPGRIEAGAQQHAMFSHQDIWPTTAGLAGLKPPATGPWKDEEGNPIYFDGINQSDYLTGKTDQKPRLSFAYILSTRMGALRMGDWKFHFSIQDAWLGPQLADISMLAVYNLKMDPGESYDRFFNGAAPTSAGGKLQTSPGRWSGSDTSWVVALAGVGLNKLNATFAKFPNIPIIPSGATIGSDVASFVPHKVFTGEFPKHHPAMDDVPHDAGSRK